MNNYLQTNNLAKWDFFIQMGHDFTIRFLSEHYPFNSLQIESLIYELDWHNLSNNPCMTFKLIDIYKRKLSWGNILNNSSLIWTNELISKYDKFIDKGCYTYTDFIKKKEFNENSQNINSRKLSRFSNLSQEDIESIIIESNDWFELSQCTEILWNDHLLSLMKISNEKYNTIHNKKIRDVNYFNYLSENKGVPWDNYLIEKYENLIDFWGISRNRNVTWDFDLLTKYKKKLRWDYLMESGTLEKLEWDWEKFQSFKDNIVEAELDFFMNKYFFDTLFGSLSFPEIAEILKQMNKIKNKRNRFSFIGRFFK
ncbi:hypothetical protein ACFQ2C_16325 [Sphingobacterium daejeonense]|uniref:Tryptophan repeat gene family protein n=1 Tax=Sphingobacterium daejeonense TaxID=371142 RepID=A0ABW3RQ34_9SPHI